MVIPQDVIHKLINLHCNLIDKFYPGGSGWIIGVGLVREVIHQLLRGKTASIGPSYIKTSQSSY